ncbi:putative ring-h2 finger protein atl21a, partial [Quercus suber]
EDGPAIRFPFRLKDRQPDQYCGYPGFDLYCNDKNDTVLELPTSVKAFVKHIDYKSQLINVTDSDNCFPRKIQGINLSSPPFQFYDRKIDSYLSDFGLFNCTPETDTDSSYLIPCLSSSRHPVYAFSSFAYVERVPILSCTKMYSFHLTWNSPFLELTWSEPARCGRCERKGKKCRFQNNSTDLKTECFDPYKDKGIVFCPISTFIITTSSSRLKPTCIDLIKLSRSTKIVTIVSILGLFLLALAVYAFYHIAFHESCGSNVGGKGDKLTMPPNPFASTNTTRVNASMPARRLNQELEVIPELD